MELVEILKSKKLLLGLLLILAIEAGWAVWYLRKDTRHETRDTRHEIFETKEPVLLFLSPSERQLPVGEKFQADVVLSTVEKSVIGIDVILKYDSEKLEVLEIIPGQVFDFYPRLEKENGQIFISAVNHQEKVFSGQGILAQLTLQGKAAGEAKLKFDFTPGETTDSNVALENSQKDALEEVRNGVYTFR